MEIRDYHRIFFIGIGGIGMSAIARYLNSLGKEIYGYDKTATDLTYTLEAEGIRITYEDQIDLIPEGLDLVIYTPAIPADHRQYNWFIDQGYTVIKRSAALGMISRASKCIAVAGTHGKTTTSSLITSILLESQVSFSAFLGGINYDLGSNFYQQGEEWTVVEADEYDRSFLQLNPTIAVLISMDADHLDIYGDHGEMREGFWLFVCRILPGGHLIFREGLQAYFPENWESQLSKKSIAWVSYGLDSGEARGQAIKVDEGHFCFDYSWDGHCLEAVRIALPGHHNIENAVASMTVSYLVDVQGLAMRKALMRFKGIYRRFERLYSDEKVVYIDDYAHHPTEVKAAINAVRELYPGEKVLGIFQPHLYTRTRDFADEFAAELSILDEVILMPIYPAREEAIPGVDSEMILEKIKHNNKQLLGSHTDILNRIKDIDKGVVITLGAGNIDLLRSPIAEILSNK